MNELGKQFFDVSFFNDNFLNNEEGLSFFLQGILDQDIHIHDVKIIDVPDMTPLTAASLLVWGHNQEGVDYQLLVKPVTADYELCLDCAMEYLSENPLYFSDSYDNLVSGVVYMSKENLFGGADQIAELIVGNEEEDENPTGESRKIWFFDLSSFYESLPEEHEDEE